MRGLLFYPRLGPVEAEIRNSEYDNEGSFGRGENTCQHQKRFVKNSKRCWCTQSKSKRQIMKRKGGERAFHAQYWNAASTYCERFWIGYRARNPRELAFSQDL